MLENPILIHARQSVNIRQISQNWAEQMRGWGKGDFTIELDALYL